MREWLRKRIGGYLDAVRLGATNEGVTNTLMRECDALAAPVPPADGAGGPIGWIVRIKDVKCFYWEHRVAEWKAGEFEDQHGVTATIDPVFLRSPSATGAAEPVALADHSEIGRKVSNQPWDIQSAIMTIAAHCTALTDEHPIGIVADLAGCISQNCLELANALAAAPVRGDREAVAPKAIAEAFSDWAWNKKGEAIGNMLAHEAAKVSFNAGAQWAVSLHVQPGAGEREAALRVVPRRPYIEDEPDGYLESDNCWIENNKEAVLQFLQSAVTRQPHPSSSEEVTAEQAEDISRRST
jgi:hypothetical protein